MSEPAERDDIIVFETFDTVIAANIIKTKLDAYGVPCFITEEHFTNLYPTHTLFTNGVRLHVFKKDEARAREIMLDVDQGGDEA